jgi:NADH:ubiquinone oxidoreductase subunit 4 (subunit M)
MLLFNRIIFGNFKINYISNWTDIDKKENFVYGLLVILTIFFGICPNYICDYTFITVLNITEILKFKLLFSF